jgi:four helix bundle protein
MGDFRNLIVYQKAFHNAMLIFELSKGFPPIEKYALTTQIRNSSRSVCSNIAEGYRKRRYPNHFISKFTDADSENSETIVWLDFALACEYISNAEHDDLIERVQEVGRLLNHATNNPGSYS